MHIYVSFKLPETKELRDIVPRDEKESHSTLELFPFSCHFFPIEIGKPHAPAALRKEQTMYTTIYTYDLLPGTKERFIQDMQERLVPFLDHVPGFRTFSLVESGDHNVTCTCTYDTSPYDA